jgi:demethylmenaquinone methyltransferase/2-methoxy-6-polyprenyl-1,4-benzoquinol methylase
MFIRIIKGNLMSSPYSAPKTTNFGFRNVPIESKKALVRDVFNSVADNYDLMNDLMSFGVHRLWKASLLDWLTPHPNKVLLDVAGGTGDIASRYKRRGGGPVIVCDINQAMLEAGRTKLANYGKLSDITWVCGDAESLPIPDRSIDAYTIAFGLRNVTSISKALKEARRVLRPGGRFMCLEFSHPAISAIIPAYNAYSFKILPEIGQLVTKDRDAYKYLVESIRKFPNQKELEERMKSVNLEKISHRNLSGGIATIHSAWRL